MLLLRVRLSPGYCWPTSFKVLGVLFLGEVFSAFWPSKKACWARQFRYLGVGQQYLPVIGTRGKGQPEAPYLCRTSRSNKLCSIDLPPPGYSTAHPRNPQPCALYWLFPVVYIVHLLLEVREEREDDVMTER